MSTFYDRNDQILHHWCEDIYCLAPIPFLYTQIDGEKINNEIREFSKTIYSKEILEVPDEKHINTLGVEHLFPDDSWKEFNKPAVGVWHSVPTNNILNQENHAINILKNVIRDKHKLLVETVGDEKYYSSEFLESWIQFYKNGDYKVLHNHERYYAPFLKNMWVGAYYLEDGEPDVDKKYSGIISFKVRGDNYFIRPKSGMLLMWPSDILHEVHPFYGKSERIVINFHIRNKKV